MGEINFLKEALDIKDEVIKLRRDFHEHPELDYDLFRTCEKVKEFLKKSKYRILRHSRYRNLCHNKRKRP